MRWLLIGTMVTLMTALILGHAGAADDSKVKRAAGHVETGTGKIGDGKIAEGAEETAKGIGNTVVEGAKLTGQKLEESGQAAAAHVRQLMLSGSTGDSPFVGAVRPRRPDPRSVRTRSRSSPPC